MFKKSMKWLLVGSLVLTALVIFPTEGNSQINKFFSTHEVNTISMTTELTFIDKDGVSYNYTLADLQAMPVTLSEGAYEGFSGWNKNGTYKGVDVAYLVSHNGNMTRGDVLRVTAEDGYAILFTFDNIFPTDWRQITQGPLVLAYEYNSTTVPTWTDGMQIVMLPEDGGYSIGDMQLTTSIESQGKSAGSRWIKNVKKIEVLHEASLQVIGNQNNVYGLAQILKMPSVYMEGGYRKTTGTIVGPYNYTGVTFEYLLAADGSSMENYSVEIIAADGYSITLNKSQTEGFIPTYDLTGLPLGVNKVVPVVAYAENQSDPLTGGPFRLMFLNETPVLTDGQLWIKEVVKIEIKSDIKEWSLDLVGIEETLLPRTEFESVASCTHHHLNYSYTENSLIHTYDGVALWTIISYFDGADDVHHNFNFELLSDDYTVRLTNLDGEYVEFEALTVAINNDILLAYRLDDEPLPTDSWPLKLVGDDVNETHSLGKIMKIELIFDVTSSESSEESAVIPGFSVILLFGTLSIFSTLWVRKRYK